jgi:1-acyl-sn-glycerol-3-phosphate acyltransferase
MLRPLGATTETTFSESTDARALSSGLLQLVAALAKDLSPGGSRQTSPTLDSRFNEDLGLDSLTLVELLLRAERDLGVSFRDGAIAAATPRELLQFIQFGPAAEAIGATTEELPSRPVGEVPSSAETLSEVLAWHARKHPEHTHALVFERPESPQSLTYQALYDRASAIAASLREEGIAVGQVVALMLPTSIAYLASFFGILLAGCIPVPIYPPARRNQIVAHVERHAGILRNAGARGLITVPEGRALAKLVRGQAPNLEAVMSVGELLKTPAVPAATSVASGDIAFLQYTSGSTGKPKGVALTHANLLANIRALAARIQVRGDDVFVSWLPLYHDMGLIGAWLGSLYSGIPLVLMSPVSFLTRPVRWLRLIDRHRGTLTASPNFGYQFCVDKIADADLEGLDLSSLRLCFNGAEPISPDTVQRFEKRFTPCGLAKNVVTPAYGLAESSLALAIPPPGQGTVWDRVEREAFYRSGQAEPADAADPDPLLCPCCGPVLAGEELRIVDDSGRELPDRQEGRIQFKGRSSTSGYYLNPEANETLFSGDWLESGDRGYMVEGQLYVTGREKDVIIRGGRNIHPQELEEAVGDIAGIRKGCVVALGTLDRRTGSERLVVLAETRESQPMRRTQLREAILARTRELFTLPADEVLLLSPHTVLKTSSGKIRRHATRQLYEQGTLESARLRQHLHLGRLAIAAVARRLVRQCRVALYSAWAWIALGLVAPIVWLAVLLLPKLKARWAAVRAGGRLLALLTGTRIHVEGLGLLPLDPCVIVANHASYLDGFVMATVIPRELRYVVKEDLRGGFLIKRFLRRVGAVLVERFDSQHSDAETKRLIALAQSGHSLVFFPEGTFFRVPGILPFRMGAFVTAAAAQVPVVPVVLRGTRSKLRAKAWWIREGDVRISVSEPIQPSGTDWQAANELRHQVREEILRRSGEPDLAREQTTAQVATMVTARSTH